MAVHGFAINSVSVTCSASASSLDVSLPRVRQQVLVSLENGTSIHVRCPGGNVLRWACGGVRVLVGVAMSALARRRQMPVVKRAMLARLCTSLHVQSLAETHAVDVPATVHRIGMGRRGACTAGPLHV